MRSWTRTCARPSLAARGALRRCLLTRRLRAAACEGPCLERCKHQWAPLEPVAQVGAAVVIRQVALSPRAGPRPPRRMIVEPGARVADFAKAGSDIITVHAEQSATIHLHRLIGQARSRPWPEPLAPHCGRFNIRCRLQHGQRRLPQPVCLAARNAAVACLRASPKVCAHAPGRRARLVRIAPPRQRAATGAADQGPGCQCRARGADPTLHPARRRSRTWASRRAWCSTRARR